MANWKRLCPCFFLLLAISGCYQLNQIETDPTKGLPIDAQYRLHSEQPPPLNAVCGNDSGDLLAMGDHGATFQAELSNFSWHQSESVAATINDCAAYQGVFLAVGSAGSIFLRDKSGSWVQVRSKTDVSLNTISIADGTIFAGGDRGTIRASSDGKEWSARNIPSSAGVASLAQCGSNLYAATSDGNIWSSLDHAKSWEDHATAMKVARSVACAPDSSVVVASSNDGHFVRSDNRGITWTDIDTHQDMTINSVQFLGHGHWLAVGGDGLGFESIDDAATWSAFQLATNNNLLSLRSFGTTLVATGDRKTILKGNRLQGLISTLGTPFSVAGLIPSHVVGMLGYGSGGNIFRVGQKQAPIKISNVGTVHDINGAAVSDAVQQILVVTNFGHVFRSSNGLSWSELNSPLPPHDHRIDFVAVDASEDGKRIAVVDSEGNVFLSTDRGDQWHRCTSPGVIKPKTIALLGDRMLVVGGTHSIRVSHDSGSMWKDISIATKQNLLASAHDSRGTAVFVGTAGEIIESVNAGEKWSDPGKNTNETNTLRTVSCMQTCSTIVAAGDGGSVWSYSDPQSGWTALTQEPLDYHDLKWLDGKLWILLPDGSIRGVDDPSKPWTDSPTNDISRLAASAGLIWSIDSDGVLSRSADHGATWSPVKLNLPSPVRGISVSASDKSMYLVGDDGLIAHSANIDDPSQSLQVDSLPPGLDSTFSVIARIHGGVLASGLGGTILRKLGDGAWEVTSVPVPTHTINAFATDLDGHDVWAFGEAGTILHSSDSGRNWVAQISPTNSDWNSAMYVLGPSGPRILCFGALGAIAITDDLGMHWVPRVTTDGDIEDAVFVPSTSEIWAVTGNGILLNSADFGENWGRADMNTPGGANAIIQIDSEQALLIAGDSGFFDLATMIGNLNTIRDLQIDTTAQELNISFTLADTRFSTNPDFALRIARGIAEKTSGVYQTLPVTTKVVDIADGRHYTLTASLLGLNPKSGELFWITPCMSWPTYARCLPLGPAKIVPLINVRDHPRTWSIVAGGLALALAQTLLLLVAPYYNIRLFLLFNTFEDLVKDKLPLGAWIVRVYRIFLIPLFAFSGRALDAWIRRHAGSLQPSRDEWANYRPLPIDLTVQGKAAHIAQPGTLELSAIASEREITIVGPGGAGKTTLARQLTLWLQDDNDLTKKLGARPISLFVGDGQPGVLDAIQSLMQDRLNMEVNRELIVAMLRKGRLAVVLDGLSERGELAESYRQELRSRLLARIIITTTRSEFDRVYSSGAVIKPTMLNSESLVSLIESILASRLSKAQALDNISVSHAVTTRLAQLDKMSVQLAVASQLAKMVENTKSGVTPLLVEAFVRQAERLIAESRPLDELPRSTAAAYLGYVRDLTNRSGAGARPFKLMKTTLRVASLCINNEYRPCPAEYETVVKTLAQDGIVEDDITALRGLGLLSLLDSDVPVRIRFELDPIAEYCAIEYWREKSSVDEWQSIRDKAQKLLPASAEFIRAIEDIENYIAARDN